VKTKDASLEPPSVAIEGFDKEQRVENIIGSIEGFSGFTLLALTALIVLKGEKAAEELRPFVNEEEKRIIDVRWWKAGSIEKNCFLVKACKRFKEKAPSLIQFRNLFWAWVVFTFFTLVIVLVDLSWYG